MNTHQAHTLAFRVGALATAVGSCMTLYDSTIPSGYAMLRFGSPLAQAWPQSLVHPVAPSLVMLGLIVLSLVAAVRPTQALRTFWAIFLLLMTTYCALHVTTLNKAEFYGGLWSALWWCWFVYTDSVDPTRLRQDGPRLATFVLMGTFLPSALGKTVPYHSPLLVVRPYGLPALFPNLVIPEGLRTAVMSLVIATEGFLGLAPLLPLRWVLRALPVVITAMFLWDMYLLPALLPVLSVGVASWIVLQGSDEHGDAASE